MDTAATCHVEYSAFEPILYLAFELSNTHWKLGSPQDQDGGHASERSMRGI
jgi:hypothetical protein